MKRYIVLIIFFMFFQNIVSVLAQANHEKEDKFKQRGNVMEQTYQIMGKIGNASIPFEQISPQIKRLENLTKENIPLYLEIMEKVTGKLQNRIDDEKAVVAGKEIIDRAAFVTLEKSAESNATEQYEAWFHQLRMLLTFQYRPHQTEVLVDCDPMLRKKYAGRLLDIYQLFTTKIEDAYDPYSSDNLLPIDGFVPPASYRFPSGSGQDMSNVEDKATREAYKKYKEDETARLNKRDVQMKAREVRDHYAKPIQEYLVDAYSLFPYRTEELEQMLTEQKIAHGMTKAILDAVRKAEKANPDQGFRIWLSKDKLFKTEAKFISTNKDDVTIENKDGRRSTIELSALRKEDQDYVKRQLDSETKTSKDETNKD
ncbi:MAG: hypothetical protein LBG58_11720 [Planctomycetaceae bacterium]|jgi:hypothetical protein|nr:hypothetical protein [Planctomycetaceae bacterium]